MRRNAVLVSILAASLMGCNHVGDMSRVPSVSVQPQRATYVNNVAFVEGRIGADRPRWFLVDTGANRSALDQSVAIELGLKRSSATTNVVGTAGSVDVWSTNLARVEFGSLRILDLEPTVQDLSSSLSPDNQGIAGILGFDAMKDSAVLFDPKNNRIAFASSAQSFGKLSAATRVPFVLDNGIPKVRAAIDGFPVELRLDTGASIASGQTTFINITQHVFDELRRSDETLSPSRYFTATGVGGEMRIPVIKGTTFQLGGMRVSSPELIVQPSVGYFAGPDAVGFLGSYSLQSWSYFIVDYPNKVLILIP